MKKTRVLITLALIALPLASCGEQREASPARSTTKSGKEQKMPKEESDRMAIAQLTIDYPPLQAYYHADSLPDRKPLVILKNDVWKDELNLRKFGEAVRYVATGDARRQPLFEFTKFSVSQDTAEVEFRYQVEGVIGSIRFDRAGGGWKASSGSVRER